MITLDEKTIIFFKKEFEEYEIKINKSTPSTEELTIKFMELQVNSEYLINVHPEFHKLLTETYKYILNHKESSVKVLGNNLKSKVSGTSYFKLSLDIFLQQHYKIEHYYLYKDNNIKGWFNKQSGLFLIDKNEFKHLQESINFYNGIKEKLNNNSTDYKTLDLYFRKYKDIVNKFNKENSNLKLSISPIKDKESMSKLLEFYNYETDDSFRELQWFNFLCKNESLFSLLIKDKKGIVIGIMAFYFNNKSNEIELEYFFISPEYQRAGLGTKLVNSIKKSIGSFQVKSGCDEFYKSVGGKLVNKEDNIYKI